MSFEIKSNHARSTAAARLKSRVMSFLKETLADFPGIGIPIQHRELYEVWIPGTQLVVWYRSSADAIEIARVWHAAQDRTNAFFAEFVG